MTSSRDRKTGYFDPASETMPSEKRAELQDRRLREFMAVVQADHPAVADRLDRAGLRPEQIRTAADLEKVPVVHHEDTSGASALADAELSKDGEARWIQALYAAGFRPGDVGQVTHSYRLVPHAAMLDRILHRMGCFSLPTGMCRLETQLAIMREVGAEAYVGTSGILLSLADKAASLGFDPQKDLPLDVGFVTGEVLGDSLRERLESRLGMILRQGYVVEGPGCLGYECPEAKGLHWPDDVIVQVADPDTGRNLGPGEAGEITVTVFDRTAPLLRYGTGDRGMLVSAPCPCGRTSDRFFLLPGGSMNAENLDR